MGVVNIETAYHPAQKPCKHSFFGDYCPYKGIRIRVFLSKTFKSNNQLIVETRALYFSNTVKVGNIGLPAELFYSKMLFNTELKQVEL